MNSLTPQQAVELIDSGDIGGPEIYAMTHQCDDAGKDYYKLYTAIKYGDLKSLPEVFDRVLLSESWKSWTWLGKPFSAASLVEYIERDPPEGLGSTTEVFRRLLDPKNLGKWYAAVTPPAHRPAKSNNNVISSGERQGNSLAYTLTRLEREKPELFARTQLPKKHPDRLSANAAAIEAGFRKQATPLEQILKLLPKLSAEERRVVRKALDD